MKKIMIAVLATALISGFVLVKTSHSEDKKLSVEQKSEQVSDSLLQKKQENEPVKTILFFMNPYGKPCQMQDEIITKMEAVKQGDVNVHYVKTTDSQSRDAFYKYGIRGLPSLIILKPDSTIGHRFSPGIQSEEEISKFL